MALTSGTKLGPYEIQSPLGAGGMGEVYRARDARLNREVAIKVLPAAFARDPERLRRFQQEAQAVAALNHPNILAIHDFGEHEGSPYLVTELLEGETLRERIRAGALSVRKATEYGAQVARGLAAAHEKGIVHRDLKPENVFVTRDARVKILDFGLAKLIRPDGAVLHDAATLASQTEPGVVMGTVGYMSPEQVKGQNADHRSDLFSFGAILYEMLSGARAFHGDTSVETMSAILNEDAPPLTDVLTDISPALSRIVHRCLEKSPEQRFQSAADLAFALQAMPGSGELSSLQSATRTRSAWIPAALTLFALSTVIAVVLWLRRPAPGNERHSSVRFSVSLPGNDSIGEFLGSSVAMSADGERVAYVADHGAERSIYVRSLDKLESVRVPGTEGGSSPFFSPDGDWLGFVADAKLKKIPLTGGQAETLCDVTVITGATWGPDDTIVYTPNFNVGLFAISAHGGTPRRLTTPDPSRGEFDILPEFLPGGKEILFTVWNSSNPSLDQARIAVLSVDSGKWRAVIEGGWAGRYTPGQLIYMRGDTLLSAPFDWKQYRIVGRPAVVAEGVWRNWNSGAAHFAVSRTGSVAYVPGTVGVPQRSLVWLDRSGQRKILTSRHNSYTAPRLSPDERRIATWLVTDVVSDIWLYDVSRDTFGRLTFGADDHSVAWSPDGKMIAFESSRSGVHQLYVQPADGTGAVTQLTSGDNEHYLCDWSPDGRHLAYVEWNLQKGADLWTIDLGSHGPPESVAKTPFTERQAAFSPDGRWIAFASDESGQSEVYVQPFPGPGPKKQISSGGGEEPAWSHSARELFYRVGGRMMSVPIRESAQELTADRPKLLFEGLFNHTITYNRSYDVGRDGRFLMVAEPEGDYAAKQVEVILNWPRAQ